MSSDNEDQPYIAPNIEFEFIEVDQEDEQEPSQQKDTGKDQGGEAEEADQEFDFPLFASAATSVTNTTTTTTTTTNTTCPHLLAVEDRGRSTIQKPIVQKISLREHSEERVSNERPESFYFANYTEEEKAQFATCALTAQDIYDQFFIRKSNFRCLNLNEYNAKVEEEKAKAKAKRRNRPGKKKRESKVRCRERREEKAKLIKQAEKERKKKEKYEKYEKFKARRGGYAGGRGGGRAERGGRGGRKVFQKSRAGNGISNASAGGGRDGKISKPKYRTE